MLIKATKYDFRLISSDKLSPNIYFIYNDNTLFKRKNNLTLCQVKYMEWLLSFFFFYAQGNNFIYLIFKIEVELIYNILLFSRMQYSDSIFL